MFKKYYKEANDDIKTNRELIDKIFEAAERPSKSGLTAKIYKFGMAAAAVVVLALSVSFLPRIMNNNNNTNIQNYPLAIAKNDEGEQTESKSQNDNVTIVDNQTQGSETDVSEDANTVTPQSDNGEQETEVENVQPIVSEEPNDNSDSHDNTPILAMETGESQEIPGSYGRTGRSVDAPGEIKAYEIAFEDMEDVTEDENERISTYLTAYFANKTQSDSEYRFSITKKAQAETGLIYMGSWENSTDNSEYTKITDFVVNEELTILYSCATTEDGFVQWNDANNML